MSNLTLSLDEEILKRARIRALEQGTSVNAVVREFLTAYGGLNDERRARETFVALSERATSGEHGGGRTWQRGDLYDERVRWPRS